MTQSRLESFVEAWANVIVGFGVNFAMNFAILPVVGLPVPTFGQNLAMGVLLTIVSVARSYAVRRWFNARIKGFAQKMTGKIK